MAYQANIPQGPDNPSVSQGDILANFQELYTCIAVNHVPLSDSSGGEGKHNFCTFPEQVSSPATLVDEGAIYTKNNGGVTDAYYRTQSSGTEYQLSCIKAFCTFNGSLAGPITPSVAMNVTNVTKTSTGVYRVNFTNALPSANYTALATCQMQTNFTTGGFVGVDVLQTTGFQVNVKPLTGGGGADVNPICIVVLQ